MDNSVKGLINVFNLNNYFCDRVNTNLIIEGKKIIGLFAYGTNVAEYLHRVGKEIIKQQYLDREIVAGRYYNLNCFPFVLSANNKKYLDKDVMIVELADSTNKEVIHNLKVHLVNELDRAVTLKLIARLVVETGITEEEGHEWVRGTVKIGAFYGHNPLKKHYLYCIAFDGEYFEREGYDSETLELFKKMYIQELDLRLRECNLESFDFYHYEGDILYIKNVSDKVVENVARYVRGRIALSFRTLGEKYSKVENFKGVLGGLIFKWAGKFVDGYDYDVFTDEKEREGGNYFALIPLIRRYDGQLELLKCGDVHKINAAVHETLMSDIRGKTTRLSVTNCESPVHAISNKKIAQVLPEIMQSPIAYNERTGHFEFAADLGLSPKLDFRSPKPDSEVFTVFQYRDESTSYLGIPEVTDVQLSSILSQSNNYLSCVPVTSNLTLLKEVFNKYLGSDEKSESLKSLFGQVWVQPLSQGSGREVGREKLCHNINLSVASDKFSRKVASELSSLNDDILGCRSIAHDSQQVSLSFPSSVSDKNSDRRSKAESRESRAGSRPENSEFLKKKYRVSCLHSKEGELKDTSSELQGSSILNTDDKSFITKMLSPFKQEIPKIAIIEIPRISLMLHRQCGQESKSQQELFSIRTPLSVLCKGVTMSLKSKLDLPPGGKLDSPNVEKHVQKQQVQKR
ncbi:hypothetical protein [Wolbachia endosymbiont of Dirofilaria (Dirofilaria) immitis]|uniref:hypothetical protein n=1 Tax=Wolbachia endosymbiont of Dirofilaria (Dirofilaria) immitis TaxID=1812115 RepID=UPI001589529C|nr:hypothetical protein [Wolbachia endosymbiont of Dirofilaria (Dirofilaria) immitis]QKX02253.1 hypothetical protein GOY12_01580 [Wolbachia endosymbiont of Dirofilaria (Dirofilaria) immitis]